MFFRSLPMATLEHKKSFTVANANSLEPAIIHTMAFKMSSEIISDKTTPSTEKPFFKELYNVSRIKKKIFFEQSSLIHMDGPEHAVCETASDSVFVLNTSFTSKATKFHRALAEACDAFK